MTYRILVTGSRDWSGPSKAGIIRVALTEIIKTNIRYGEFVLVHGACPKGADRIAHFTWEAFRRAEIPTTLLPAEQYPGELFRSFKERNQHMVNLGADVCLAFATNWASGTGQTARMARRAGIRTLDFGADTRIEAR